MIPRPAPFHFHNTLTSATTHSYQHNSSVLYDASPTSSSSLGPLVARCPGSGFPYRRMNPNWNEEYNSTQNSAGNGKRDSNIHLFGRNVFSGAEYKCGGTLPECHPTGIATGIDYLRSVKGKPKNGPGPGNCGRVSCTQNGAIWWCNDNASSKTLDGFGDIADGAEYLGKKCTRWGWENGSYKAFLSGKAFHEDNWNVIVQKDSC
ncbi:hypothetical protein FPOAC1_003708 [Fusarium poae]|uniref:hypothetical protein n=1 Tax=Fusarium poae TaxID=36050 RepID=UPI001CEB6E53|nr:hypothetical protein FPOAC1_003708 [Fusarium poae]KAG8677681.1 hypothetical protein FPOAC1_003708 [Fusarium poae]